MMKLDSPFINEMNDQISSESTNINGKNSEKISKSSPSVFDSAQRVQIQQYLHTVSGQLIKPTIQEIEHNYAKCPHINPDPQIYAQPTKYLFMKHFPRHLTGSSSSNKYQQQSDDDIDVVTYDEMKKIPFLTPKPPPIPIKIDEDIAEIDSSITDKWTNEKNKLWTRATKIIHSDRMARLSFEGHVNEVLLKRNLQDHTTQKFRELFSSTFWNSKLLEWLHETLLEHLNINYQQVYIESLQILRQKIPTLIERFYHVKDRIENKNRPTLNDPLFNTLSHYKPKKLPRKPIFILVPNGPNQNLNQTNSPRLKYWSSLLSSMGKLVSLSVPAKPTDYIADILNDIRYVVNEKIKNCKNSYSSRPVVLIGFNSASVLAVHCALQNPRSIAAIVCLGFPLKTINGNRGELGDTILELSCPIQFIIGENSVLTPLDDIEDFRERMTRSETNLIVVGGADDKLVVSNIKKRLECLTQSMVDRCIVDEIYEFLSPILMNYNEDSNGYCCYNNQTTTSPSLAMNKDTRLYRFIHDEHGQTSITGSSSTSNRKRSSSSRKRNKIDQDSSMTTMMMNLDESNKSTPKRKRTSRSTKKDQIIMLNDINNSMNNDRTPGTITTTKTNINNNNNNFAQILGRSTVSNTITNPTSFTLVPYQPQLLSSSTSTTTLTNIDKQQSQQQQQQFSNIKIEKSQIISIDNFPLTTITKKIVKKTTSPTAIHLASLDSFPTTSTSTLSSSSSSISTSVTTITTPTSTTTGSTQNITRTCGREIRPPKSLDF